MDATTVTLVLAIVGPITFVAYHDPELYAKIKDWLFIAAVLNFGVAFIYDMSVMHIRSRLYDRLPEDWGIDNFELSELFEGLGPTMWYFGVSAAVIFYVFLMDFVATHRRQKSQEKDSE